MVVLVVAGAVVVAAALHGRLRTSGRGKTSPRSEPSLTACRVRSKERVRRIRRVCRACGSRMTMERSFSRRLRSQRMRTGSPARRNCYLRFERGFVSSFCEKSTSTIWCGTWPVGLPVVPTTDPKKRLCTASRSNFAYQVRT